MLAREAQGLESLLGHISHILDDVQPGESLPHYASRRNQVVEDHVRAMAALMAPYDAFDVLDLMRQREVPFTLTGFSESQSDNLAAAVELVATILIARGVRAPVAESSNELPPPNRIITELHRRCRTILSMGTLSALATAEQEAHGPLTMLAAHFSTHELNVRYKQYAHIHDEFNHAFFEQEEARALVRGSLGFTLEDFEAVREGIRQVYIDGLEGCLDSLGEIVQDWEARGRVRQSEDEVQRGSNATNALFFYPGERAASNIEEIVSRSRVETSVVEQIVRLFGTKFQDQSDPVQLVQDFLDGRNRFARSALLFDEQDRFISLSVPIGTDCFRQTIEDALKGTPSWGWYDKHRAAVAEQLTAKYLQKLLAMPPSHVGLNYFVPKEGVTTAALVREATNITQVSEKVEADALFIVEDVAICVEVKAGGLTTRARQGHVQRLANDLKKTVGDATKQALRLEKLITDNGGLWLEGLTWLDLSHVREVRSIAVCLEDMGPLGIALDELVRANVIQEERFPWIVSLHDLAIINEVLERPAEFLLYLRRRTESDVSRLYHAVDELDLFMLFVEGGLYIEPDPETVFREHPTSGRPTAMARRRYAQNAVPTRVHTHTDPLDAWVYRNEGSSIGDAKKPSFGAESRILKIVDFLRDSYKPGWFRFSADLLNLSSAAQKHLATSIKQLVRSTRRDGDPHSLLHCYAGSWGFPTLFIATQPPGMSLGAAMHRLSTYMTAKKYQLRSDRALGLVLDSKSEIAAACYDNSIWHEDEELEELGKSIGLIPIEAMNRAVPPVKKQQAKVKKKRRKKMSKK